MSSSARRKSAGAKRVAGFRGNSMADLEYRCPQCRQPLASRRNGDFDTWECTQGHGVGLTLTEAYGHLQEDEIHAIWKAAAGAPKSALASPLLGHPMVAVTVVVDDDEVEGNTGSGAHPVTLDVAVDEQFLWFHVVDFKAMPADLPNPPPSAADVARLDSLKDQSSRWVARDADSEESALSKLGYRFGSRAAALLHLTSFTRKLGEKARAELDG
jgi:hypothetical protein